MDLLCTTVNLFAFAPMGYQPIGVFSFHSKQTISKYHQILINTRKTRGKQPRFFAAFQQRFRHFRCKNAAQMSKLLINFISFRLLSPFFSFTRLFRTIPAFFITIPAAFQRIMRKNIAFSGFYAIFGRTAPEIPAKIFIFAGIVRRKGYFL